MQQKQPLRGKLKKTVSKIPVISDENIFIGKTFVTFVSICLKTSKRLNKAKVFNVQLTKGIVKGLTK